MGKLALNKQNLSVMCEKSGVFVVAPPASLRNNAGVKQPKTQFILDANAKAHSEACLAHIVATIRQQGPISFEQYMQLALYQPGLGYYSAGAKKLGAAGDFVTAPEISALYSYCLAKQCQQILANVSDGNILEFGAGTGIMARDILLWLAEHAALPAHYFILEVSADLRQRQQALLQQLPNTLASRVVWLEAWPTKFNGVILANEVLDAMPVRRFCWDQQLQECFVEEKNGELAWLIEAPSIELKKAVTALQIDFTAPYLSEVNCHLAPWFKSLSASLEKGVALFIDYGFSRSQYYCEARNQGTLMCHLQHHAHDNPLILPGIQDITAHVDFTAVAEAADANDLTVLAYTNQALFLLGCGIEKMLTEGESEVERMQLTQQIKKLTLPHEMGELFKVLAVGKNYSAPLLGFSFNNQLERL